MSRVSSDFVVNVSPVRGSISSRVTKADEVSRVSQKADISSIDLKSETSK